MWLTTRVKKLVLFSVSVGTGGAGGGGVAVGGGAISLEPLQCSSHFQQKSNSLQDA